MLLSHKNRDWGCYSGQGSQTIVAPGELFVSVSPHPLSQLTRYCQVKCITDSSKGPLAVALLCTHQSNTRLLYVEQVLAA